MSVDLNINKIEITLPEPQKIIQLDRTLFLLYRGIESQYRELPWPSSIKKIAVMTQVVGGRGDIIGAAKAISIMQRICPSLQFDWVLIGNYRYQPQEFLVCDDPTRVEIRDQFHAKSDPADFLLTGPIPLEYDMEYIQNRISRRIEGPTFGFSENGSSFCAFQRGLPEHLVRTSTEDNPIKTYKDLHSYIFPAQTGNNLGVLPMGLQHGSGVFLNQSLKEAPLSRGYCCPSYLLDMQDAELKRDILHAMDVVDDQSTANFDVHSFNSGYAHNSASWEKFIDFVAIHEKDKHVVIVLNQQGEFIHLSTEKFCESIFTSERLSFLKNKGFGAIALKGQGQQWMQLTENAPAERRLSVIIRPSFAPGDMRCMQLASERLLATGDNSAVEAWCARCKLYLYEDVANMGCKWRFLQQQVDLAKDFSPSLSKLLALFGGDRRLNERCLNESLSKEKMAEAEELLKDPGLSEATLKFCEHITQQFAFAKVLEGAVKRVAWLHCIPELTEIEVESLDEKFRAGLVSYLKQPEGAIRHFTLGDLSLLGKRVQEAVLKWERKS